MWLKLDKSLLFLTYPRRGDIQQKEGESKKVFILNIFYMDWKSTLAIFSSFCYKISAQDEVMNFKWKSLCSLEHKERCQFAQY